MLFRSNKRVAIHVVSLPLVWESPLRTGNLRDPNGPQSTFASESFIDEMAALAKADPLDFRVGMIERSAEDSGFRKARSLAVLKAAAEKYGWERRPAGGRRATGDILAGRGVAYTYRNQTVVAQMVDVEVNRKTGRVWVKRIVCAHDCGLVINPEGLRYTIEGNVVQGISRTLFEEVRFDRNMVTSVDWNSYPILDIRDTPQTIEFALINRPEVAPSGAGEPTMRVVPAAIANAFFDATGVRMRRVPMTPERVKAALAKAASAKA